MGRIGTIAAAIVVLALAVGFALLFLRHPTRALPMVEAGCEPIATRYPAVLGADSIPKGAKALMFAPMLGQSNSIGFGAPAEIITCDPVRPGQVLMFNGGARPMQNDGSFNGKDGQRRIDDAQFAALTDLRENYGGPTGKMGETHGGGFGYGITSGIPQGTVVVFATFGVGGVGIAAMQPGKPAWENMTRAAATLKRWCDARGIQFSVPFLLWDQGEGDTRDAEPARYAHKLLAEQAAFDSAMNLLAGPSSRPRPIIFQQISSAGAYGVDDASMSAAVLDAAIRHPDRLIPNMPEYFLKFDDKVHYSDKSRRLAGEYLGRTAARFLMSQPSTALYATRVSGSGERVTIETNASSPLVIDTKAVIDPGQYGLRLFSDAGEVPLSNIAVSGSRITADAPLVPDRRYWLGIGYRIDARGKPAAGPKSGQRANFRDSNPDKSSEAAGSVPLFNWLMHEKLAFTAS